MKNNSQFTAYLLLILFFDAMGFGLILPVTPDLIIEISALPVSEAAAIGGYLLFAFAIMQFFFTPLLGALSDSFGRRPVILLALAGFSVSYFVMAAASSLAWLFIGRLIAGAFGATHASVSAAIMDITDKEQRAQKFGLIGAAIGLGLIFGPAIGGLLGEYGARAPFLVAGALTGLASLYGFFALPESLAPQKRRRFELRRANPIGAVFSISRERAAALILGALFCLHLASQSYNSIWAFYTIEIADWSPRAIGISVALYGVMMAIVQGGLTGPTVAKFGEVRSAFFSMIAGVIIYIGFAVTRTGAEIYFWVIVSGLSGFAYPALQALLSKNIPDNAQGELQGAIFASYSFTSIIGPLIMTQAFSTYSDGDGAYFPGAPFIVAAVIITLSLFIFQSGVSRLKKSEQ